MLLLSRDQGLKNAIKTSLFTGLRLHGKLIGKINVHITAKKKKKPFIIRLQTTVSPDELFLSLQKSPFVGKQTFTVHTQSVHQFSIEETLMHFLPCIRITSLSFASSSLQHFSYLTSFLMHYNSRIYNLFLLLIVYICFPLWYNLVIFKY